MLKGTFANQGDTMPEVLVLLHTRSCHWTPACPISGSHLHLPASGLESFHAQHVLTTLHTCIFLLLTSRTARNTLRVLMDVRSAGATKLM